MGSSEFRTTLTWVGNDGTGTSPRTYAKDGGLAADGRPTIPTHPPDGPDGWRPGPVTLLVPSAQRREPQRTDRHRRGIRRGHRRSAARPTTHRATERRPWESVQP